MLFLIVTAVDTTIWQLFVSKMVQQIVNESGTIVLLRVVRVWPVDNDKFATYRNELLGLTTESMSQIKVKLIKLGISTGSLALVEQAT